MHLGDNYRKYMPTANEEYFDRAHRRPSAERMTSVYGYVSPELEDKEPTNKRVPESWFVPHHSLNGRTYTTPVVQTEPKFKIVTHGMVIPRKPVPRVQSMYAELSYANSVSSCSSDTNPPPVPDLPRPALGRTPTDRQFSDFLPPDRVKTWNEVKESSGSNYRPFRAISNKGLKVAKEKVASFRDARRSAVNGFFRSLTINLQRGSCFDKTPQIH
ncbi:hypothetical protein BKA63DRAFT_490859 [Paraphoma chrysanthemicola]|nr:hypothetical protein BKA63DRAFT_490859 [Paraphoma chrysanthemicola]